MQVFSSLAVSGSALTAEKLRMEIIAGNIANINTTRTAAGGPYQRRMVVFAEYLENARLSGVKVKEVIKEDIPPRLEHEPGHPDADEEGYVAYPDINIINEMIDAMSASRAYESNVTAFNNLKAMASKALEIGRI